MNVPQRSPWGKVDSAAEIAPGIMSISTPGHGGVKLDRARNAQMPKAVRRKGGWYEEDCEWALVALVFPDAFEGHVEDARRSVKDWFPVGYEAITGDTVAVEDSRVLRQRAFEADTADKFVARSARGDWADDVPTGMVGITAFKRSTGDTETFLVPADEYNARSEFGYVVDECSFAPH